MYFKSLCFIVSSIECLLCLSDGFIVILLGDTDIFNAQYGLCFLIGVLDSSSISNSQGLILGNSEESDS